MDRGFGKSLSARVGFLLSTPIIKKLCAMGVELTRKNIDRRRRNAMLRALGVSVLTLMALASSAGAFNQGDVSQGTFVGCDTLEDAKAFFQGVEKASDQASTCGTIRNTATIYVREVETALVGGGKVTIHLVKLWVPGLPEQYVATFTKLQEM